MTLAVFGDVHGNLAALDTAPEDIRRRAPDRVVCLGDLVGYAPFPNEVPQRIREAQILTT